MNRTPNVSLTRRGLVTGLGSAVVLAMGGKELLEFDEWEQRANVFIADAPSYEVDLEKVIRGGLRELGIAQSQIKGKSILLKPNLVETSLGKPQINTNPLLIRAAALVFRSLGARSVSVGEGPGHCRDAFLAIEKPSAILDQPHALANTLELPQHLKKPRSVPQTDQIQLHHHQNQVGHLERGEIGRLQSLAGIDDHRPVGRSQQTQQTLKQFRINRRRFV